MPCHHKLKSYIDAVGISGDRKGPLFLNAVLKIGKRSKERMSRRAVLYMAYRCGSDAGIETRIGCPTFHATGITDYLTNGERIEVALKNGREFKREYHRPL